MNFKKAGETPGNYNLFNLMFLSRPFDRQIESNLPGFSKAHRTTFFKNLCLCHYDDKADNTMYSLMFISELLVLPVIYELYSRRKPFKPAEMYIK